MVHQSNDLLNLEYNHRSYYLFVFFSTICSYNLHWYLTEGDGAEKTRIYWTHQHKNLQLFLVAGGFAMAAWFAIPFLEHWLWLAGSVLFTFLYTAPKMPFRLSLFLRKIAIAKTLYLSFVWTYVTTVLPTVFSESDLEAETILFIIARFFFIYAICVMFDYRDRESDRKEGIRSLITLLNERGINGVFYSSIAISIVAYTSLFFFAMPFFLVLILIIPVIIATMLYPSSKGIRSDYFYYFILDGLMMLSALFTPFLSF